MDPRGGAESAEATGGRLRFQLNTLCFGGRELAIHTDWAGLFQTRGNAGKDDFEQTMRIEPRKLRDRARITSLLVAEMHDGRAGRVQLGRRMQSCPTEAADVGG